MRWVGSIGRWSALYVAYVVLFILGTSTLGPAIDRSSLTPADQALSGQMLLVVAAIDVALLGAWIAHSRLRGVRLWAAAVVVAYGVKTFSSQLETWYFVKSTFVTAAMLPHLFAMTLPVCVIWPALAVWLVGPRGDPEPATPLGYSTASLAGRLLLGGAVLYPALFFLFGYEVAWQDAAVRAYYQGPAVPLPFVQHFANLFGADPLVLPFEMARGLLWLAIGWPVLRHTRGPWWVGVLLYASMMALVQNDLHLLPNPLMPVEVREAHFVETASSNFLFVGLAGALLAPLARVARPARTAPADQRKAA